MLLSLLGGLCMGSLLCFVSAARYVADMLREVMEAILRSNGRKHICVIMLIQIDQHAVQGLAQQRLQSLTVSWRALS